MYYLVYKITNNINGKIYIGCHQTQEINDGYMGSGKLISRAIIKYGIDNFAKEIVTVYSNPSDMFNMESEIVNEEFISSPNTYNLKLGGEGGPVNMKQTMYYTSGNHAQHCKQIARLGGAQLKEQKQIRIVEYNKKPTLCKLCQSPLSYMKRKNKFCSKSCSTTFNNTGKVASTEQRLKTSNTLKHKFNMHKIK